MHPGIVRAYAADHIEVLDDGRKLFRCLIGDICNHHIFRGVGDKLVLHDGQALPRFGCVRQKDRKVGVDFYSSHRQYTVHRRCDEKQQKDIAEPHNKCGDAVHDVRFFSVSSVMRFLLTVCVVCLRHAGSCPVVLILLPSFAKGRKCNASVRS
mgnify:CR=1 FL=1